MEKELVLKVMKEAGKPIAAGEVATLSGLEASPIPVFPLVGSIIVAPAFSLPLSSAS